MFVNFFRVAPVNEMKPTIRGLFCFPSLKIILKYTVYFSKLEKTFENFCKLLAGKEMMNDCAC